MRSWSARFRRAAAVLLGIHLTQATALAAVAPCDVLGGAGSATATATAPAPLAATPHDHAGHHQAGESTPAPHHPTAPHAPSNCPMAMACAVAASPTVPITLPSVSDRLDDVRGPRLTVDRLASLTHAPEPPPPKS